MVVGAAPVLSPRWVVLGGLLAVFALYTAIAEHASDLSFRGDVALVALVLFPVVTGAVWLSLPLARSSAAVLIGATGICGVVAVGLGLLDATALFDVAKIATFALLGFWFLRFFEALWWLALVALLVPLVDIWSVDRGPTHEVIVGRPSIFENVSVTFQLPGETETANLGPPDILFFALFLAAAQRFELRVGLTWLAMTAFLSLTLVATAAWDVNGLPALPAICLGFLLPNVDVIWCSVRRARSPVSGP